MPKILITGASGQIGSELTEALVKKYGQEHIIASDIREFPDATIPFVKLDVTSKEEMDKVFKDHEITQVYHLAAVLSAKGESDPRRTWSINMDSWLNVLELATIHKIDKIFFPSSIAVYGSASDLDKGPQFGVLDPDTVYGITKQAGESWARYFSEKKGLDIRCIRFPGLISYKTAPGGGTTDYAIDIFHQAVKRRSYSCFLGPNTRLPMLFLKDAIQGILKLMDAPKKSIHCGLGYNIGGMNFTPAELAEKIKMHIPGFEISYDIDFRQAIADGWPRKLDDQAARKDWGWTSQTDIDALTEIMLQKIGEQHALSPSNQ